MKRFVNGEEVELETEVGVEITPLPDRMSVRTREGVNTAVVIRTGDSVHVSYRGSVYLIEKARSRARAQGGVGSGEVRAPMPGQIVEVFVKEGQSVVKGEKLLVLEAMKTHQSFGAAFDGVIEKVQVSKGDQVADGDLLCLVRASDSA